MRWGGSERTASLCLCLQDGELASTQAAQAGAGCPAARQSLRRGWLVVGGWEELPSWPRLNKRSALTRSEEPSLDTASRSFTKGPISCSTFKG